LFNIKAFPRAEVGTEKGSIFDKKRSPCLPGSEIQGRGCGQKKGGEFGYRGFRFLDLKPKQTSLEGGLGKDYLSRRRKRGVGAWGRGRGVYIRALTLHDRK